MLAELNLLRGAILGDREIPGRESADGVAALVLDRNGFDHELRADGKRGHIICAQRRILADLLRRSCDSYSANDCEEEAPHPRTSLGRSFPGCACRWPTWAIRIAGW